MGAQVGGQNRNSRGNNLDSEIQKKLGIAPNTRLSSVSDINSARVERNGSVTFAIDTDGRNGVGISYVRSNGAYLSEDCYSNNQVANLAKLDKGQFRMTDGTFTISAKQKEDATRVIVNVSSDIAAVKIRLGNETYLIKLEDLKRQVDVRDDARLKNLSISNRSEVNQPSQAQNPVNARSLVTENVPVNLGQGPESEVKARVQDKIQTGDLSQNGIIATNSGSTIVPLTIAATRVLSHRLPSNPLPVRPVEPTSNPRSQSGAEPDTAAIGAAKIASELETEIARVGTAVSEVNSSLGSDSTAIEAEDALKKLNKDYNKLQKQLKAFEKVISGASLTAESEDLLKKGRAALEECLEGRKLAAELMITSDEARTIARGKNALVAMSDDIKATFERKIALQSSPIGKGSLTSAKAKFDAVVEAYVKEGYGSFTQKVSTFVADRPKIQAVLDFGRRGSGLVSQGRELFGALNEKAIELGQKPLGATLKNIPSSTLKTGVAIYNVATTRSVLVNANKYLSSLEGTDAKPIVMKDLDKLDSALSKRQGYLENRKVQSAAILEELEGVKEVRGNLAGKASKILTAELEAAKVAHGTNASAKLFALVAAAEEKLYGKWGAQIDAISDASSEFKSAKVAYEAKVNANLLYEDLSKIRKLSARSISKTENVQSATRVQSKAIVDAKQHTTSTFAKVEVELSASKLRLAEFEALSNAEGASEALKAHIQSSIKAEKASITALEDLATKSLIEDIEGAASKPLETQKYLSKKCLATQLTSIREELVDLQKSLSTVAEADRAGVQRNIKSLQAKIAVGELEHVTDALTKNEGALKLINDRLSVIEVELAGDVSDPLKVKGLTEEQARLKVSQKEVKALNEMFDAQKEVLSHRSNIATKHLALHDAKVGGASVADLAGMESELARLEKVAIKMQSQLETSMSKKLADASRNFRETIRNGAREAAYYTRHPIKGAGVGVSRLGGAAMKPVGALDRAMVDRGWNPSFSRMAAATTAVESLIRVGGADYSPETRHTAMPHLIIALNRHLGDWAVEDLGQGNSTSDLTVGGAIATETISGALDTGIILGGGTAVLKGGQLGVSAASWVAHTRYAMPLTNWVAGTRVAGVANSQLSKAAHLLKSPLFGSSLSAVGAGYGGYKAFSEGQFLDMNQRQINLTATGYVSAGALGGAICGGPVGAGIGAVGGAVGELYGVSAGLASLDKKIADSWVRKGAKETLERGIYGLTKSEEFASGEDLFEGYNALREGEKDVVDHFALMKLLPSILGENSNYSPDEIRRLGLLRAGEQASDKDKERVDKQNWARINKLVYEDGLKKLGPHITSKVLGTLEGLKLDYTELYMRSYKKEYQNVDPQSTWSGMLWGATSEKYSTNITDDLSTLTTKMEKAIVREEELFDVETFMSQERPDWKWEDMRNIKVVRDALLRSCWSMDEKSGQRLISEKAYDALGFEFEVADDIQPIESLVRNLAH